MFTRDENTITGTDGDDDIIFDTFVDPDNRIYSQVLVYGSGGNDTINPIGGMSIQHLSIYGGEGDDIIRDNDGGDFLSGDAGNDTIYSGTSYRGEGDTVFGGEGNDTIVIAGDAKADGGTGDDTFVLSGRFGYQESADLAGGEGVDQVVASGDFRSVTFDSIEELQIDGWITLGAASLETITHISAYQGKRANAYFADATIVDATPFDMNFHGTITGSGSDDVLNFSQAANRIDLVGGNGNDILNGSSADNKLYGGLGDDTIYGGAGDDKISVESPDRSGLSGTGENLAFGGAGNDEIILGDRGISTVFGGAGDDLVNGRGYGSTTGLEGEWHGGAGDDVFQLSYYLGSDLTIIGGAGIDIIQFYGEIPDAARINVDIWESAYIVAAPEMLNDISEIRSVAKRIAITLSDGGVFRPQSIHGQATLIGSDEDDTIDLSHTLLDQKWKGISLGRGDDTFIGTVLNEKIRGERGNDTFVFNDHSGHDGISDFANNRRETDVLDFSKSKIINNISDFKAHFSDDGLVSFGDTEINLHSKATDLEDLTGANFIF
jgi:Ca2+-binding RTX toxin-like protein